MKIRLVTLAAAIVISSSGGVRAESTTTFESCTDTSGRTLPVQEDSSLPTLVATIRNKAGASIHYNPSVLPRLKPATRLFFFAHECARNSLGDSGRAAMSVEWSQRADCLGLSTLLDGGLLKREELADLQADLSFSEAEWALLPGLPRTFDLGACHSRGVVKLPAATPPSAGQVAWDKCVRGCAGPLLSCGDRCMDTYRQCVAGCGSRPDK